MVTTEDSQYYCSNCGEHGNWCWYIVHKEHCDKTRLDPDTLAKRMQFIHTGGFVEWCIENDMVKHHLFEAVQIFIEESMK